jgi:methyl-galactoside transport system substrate-binding protein
MSKRRFIVLGIALIAVAAGIFGGYHMVQSKENTESQVIRVGITMYNQYDPFTEEIRHNIEDYLAAYGTENDIEVDSTVVYSGKNQLVQNDQVIDFIDKNYDVICVNIVDRTDPSVIIEAAKSADVPIIFFNRELVEDDLKRFNKLYYVGARPEDSGKIQGEIVIDALNDCFDEIDVNGDGIIQYVLLEGEAGHQDAILRSRVSVETIKAAGYEMEMLGDEIANWDRKQAQTKMTALLAGYPRQIELVLANDDNMALGALDALTSYGVQTLPMIVGVNGQEEALDMIQDGLMEGTVLNDSAEKGHIIAKMAVGLGVYGKVPADISLYNNKYYYVPYRKVDRNSYYSQ